MPSLHILILLLDHPPFQAYMSAPELLSMAAVANTITSANLANGEGNSIPFVRAGPAPPLHPSLILFHTPS